MSSRSMPGPPPRGQRPRRVIGYGTDTRLKTKPEPGPRGSVVVIELAAWVATTVLAAALVLLLARHDLLLAVPVVLGYAIVSWLLWTTRRTKKRHARTQQG